MADAVLSVELVANIDSLRDSFNRAIRETSNLSRETRTRLQSIDQGFADLATSAERNVGNRSTNAVRRLGSETRNTTSNVNSGTSSMTSGLNKLGGAVATAFSVGAVIGFGKSVIQTTSEFEKFSAVLGNTLGSQALADLKLKELQEFASKTPFGVNELTGAFVKLANSGFKPTGEQMTKLGDLASSTGKSFDQLAEAILDAQSGEFERLKEFGVRAKDAGDKVIFTYKGVQTEVEKASGAIRDYITSLGGAEGVSGSMAKISETLGGQISNLGDEWDQMLLSVGGNTTGVFSKSISIISIAISKVTEFNDELEVASKYNLGSTFGDLFDTLFKYSAAGRGIDTPTEKLSQSILNARKEVSAYVSSALSGAKATGDFGKALAGLKSKGDQALKAIKDPGAVKGISDAYQTGVKAIQDARVNFGKVTSDANFGTKGGKSVKTITDTLKELDSALLLTSVQFKSTFDDENKAKISAYQSAINSLVKMGYDPASEAVTRLKKAQQDLFQLPELNKFISATTGVKQPGLDEKGKPKELGLVSSSRGVALSEITKEQQAIIESQLQFNEDFNYIVSEGLAGGIASLASSFGEVLANGGNVFDALSSSLLGSLGAVLTQLGEMAIGVGIGLVAIKKALQSLNPAVAIAGGVALIALGAFVSSKSQSIGGSIKGGNATKPTAFANGGIVYGPTLGLMGEYSGASNNPEVIAPLNKLKGLIGDNSPKFEIIQFIDNKKLAVMVRNANEETSRTTSY